MAKGQHPNSLAALKPCQPGETRNPGGMAVGTRKTLNKKFLVALSKEFDRSGAAAIRKVAKKDPATFIRVLAAILPSEVELKRTMEEFTDEQLDAAADAIRALLAAKQDRDGKTPAPGTEPPAGLSTLQ